MCVVHFMLTPKTLELQGMRCLKHHHQQKLLSSCFAKRISLKSILLSDRNVFLVKAALEMVQKAVQLQFRKTKGKRLAHSFPQQVVEQLLPWRDLEHGIVLWSVVPCSKLKIKPQFLQSCPPLPQPSPHPAHIYRLVLELTQFLQEFFFHLPELDTHRHFSYELLTAFLGNLLAVPQVNVTDISTAFEEGQAQVSNLITV